MTAAATKPGKNHPAWLPAALDYGPLFAYFAGYKVLGIFGGTAVFMIAIAVAVGIALWKIGRVSPMMWLSAILVIGFGGLTIWMHDQRFIQIKPTVIYAMLSSLLFIGLLRGRPLLRYVLEHGYHGLSERGWMILSRNWAWFFAVMALFNEILRRNVGFDEWLTIKVWGLTALSMIFAAANVPMLMRHGLGNEEEKAAG